jgi:hypothetical protein
MRKSGVDEIRRIGANLDEYGKAGEDLEVSLFLPPAVFHP